MSPSSEFTAHGAPLRDRLQRSRAAACGPTALSELPAAIAAHLSPRLAERLARLRPQGASLRRPVLDDAEVAAALHGRVLARGVIMKQAVLTLPHRHGGIALRPEADWRACSGLDRQLGTHGTLCFVDTETNGIAGGTGTIAFVTGLLTIDRAVASLTQWVLTGFEGEAAMLDALRAQIPSDARLVTYNGKAFDIPLLDARLRLHGRGGRFGALRHLDLLHWMRAHRGRDWQDCRLRTVEAARLGVHREGDIEGRDVPAVWRAWLGERRVEPMARVIAHNRLDLLSLAALLQDAIEQAPDDLLRPPPTRRPAALRERYRWSSQAISPCALRSISSARTASNVASE